MCHSSVGIFLVWSIILRYCYYLGLNTAEENRCKNFKFTVVIYMKYCMESSFLRTDDEQPDLIGSVEAF